MTAPAAAIILSFAGARLQDKAPTRGVDAWQNGNAMTLYVIGDVHGQLDLLKAAHERVFRDGGKDALIAHVGDLVDRGPDSCGVITHLAAGLDQGRPWKVMLGNHDRMMSRFLTDPDWIDPGLALPVHWLDHPHLGAADTLRSYGVDPDRPRAQVLQQLQQTIPQRHIAFLAELLLWFLHPLAIVVHAGIRPGVALKDQSEDDLVWIRKGFLDSTADHGTLIVHGHTAIDTATHYGNRLNVDGGAAYGRPLCAVRITAYSADLLTDNGAVPLHQNPSAATATSQ